MRSPRLSVHVAWLLSELEPKADAIRELLGRGIAADIFCFSTGAIPRSLRARAEALGLRIGIDHYDARP